MALTCWGVISLPDSCLKLWFPAWNFMVQTRLFLSGWMCFQCPGTGPGFHSRRHLKGDLVTNDRSSALPQSTGARMQPREKVKIPNRRVRMKLLILDSWVCCLFSKKNFFNAPFGNTPCHAQGSLLGVTQGLFLALCSGITASDVWKTIYDSRDQTEIGCVQSKLLVHCTISLALKRPLFIYFVWDHS